MKSKTTLKSLLEKELPEKVHNILPRSFEVVGTLAIIEIPEELNKFEKEIGKAILKLNSHITTVLKKSSNHSGEFRTKNLEVIAGENTKETTYLENGVRLKINPETVYFSSKLSTEREQLMENLEENKRVLVMFSGAGPYSFVALKKQPNLARIASIEINPCGHKYAMMSLKLNKNLLKKSKLWKNLEQFCKENKLPIREKEVLENLNQLKIHFINADVKKLIPKLQLEKKKEYIETCENFMFEGDIKESYDKLSKFPQGEILTIYPQDIKKKKPFLYLYILFAHKFSFCIVNENEEVTYLHSDLEKSYLLNILEGQNQDKIEKYDEMYMPLPKDAELFLEEAFTITDKNCIIHMYDFVHENEFPQKSEQAVIQAAKQYNKKVKIIQTRKVGQYSPRKFRVCCDFIVK